MDLFVRTDNPTTEPQSWSAVTSITDDSLLAVWWLIRGVPGLNSQNSLLISHRHQLGIIIQLDERRGMQRELNTGQTKVWCLDVPIYWPDYGLVSWCSYLLARLELNTVSVSLVTCKPIPSIAMRKFFRIPITTLSQVMKSLRVETIEGWF